MTRDVAAIVPTFEESQTIASVVEGVAAALAPRYDYSILVVDDSPGTATVDVLEERYGDDPRIAWEHRQGDGLASAVLEGFDRADARWFAVLDGDLQHPPERVRNLVGRLELGADLAVGSRHVDGGDVVGDWPAHRRVISRGADALARIAVPTARKLSDPMSGFFAVDAELVEAVRDRLDPCGYKILLELCARAPVAEIHEVPYRFRERAGGESNLGPGEYARYVRHLARLSIPARRESVQVVGAEVGDV